MTKDEFKAAIIEFVNMLDFVDQDYKPGRYYFDCTLKIEDDRSVLVSEPKLIAMVTKK